jgi:hypothetical protein
MTMKSNDYLSIAMLLLIEQTSPKLSQIKSYGYEFAHNGGGLFLQIKRTLFCVTCEHLISLPAICSQTYHMFASLMILVDPLVNISQFTNHVLVYISYVCESACEPTLAPMQKRALASFQFAISSAGMLAHQNDGMTPLYY